MLLTFACGVSVRLYKTGVPEQVERDTINITQTDYAQARAKWDAQKVGVYEMRYVDPRVSAKMRVDRGTGDIFLLELTLKGHPESVDGLSAPLSGVTAEVYQPYTIDAVYDSIRDTLARVSAGEQAANNGDITNFHDYEVKFDADHGYPLHFKEQVRTTLSSQEITWRADASELEIKDFAAIK